MRNILLTLRGNFSWVRGAIHRLKILLLSFKSLRKLLSVTTKPGHDVSGLWQLI